MVSVLIGCGMAGKHSSNGQRFRRGVGVVSNEVTASLVVIQSVGLKSLVISFGT
jgi:hypothetical protein